MKIIRILFLEDEKLLRTLLEDAITGFGDDYRDYKFEMETVADLKSALIYLKDKSAPNIILLDLRLPTGGTGKISESPEKENGLTILRTIKEAEKFKNTPVIVFTNLNDKETEHECNRLGADGFMVKSKTLPSELLGRVVKLVK